MASSQHSSVICIYMMKYLINIYALRKYIIDSTTRAAQGSRVHLTLTNIHKASAFFNIPDS